MERVVPYPEEHFDDQTQLEPLIREDEDGKLIWQDTFATGEATSDGNVGYGKVASVNR